MPFTRSILARQVGWAAVAVLAGAAQAAEGDGLDAASKAPQAVDVGWEGAIGLLVAHRPAFSGSEGAVTKLTPGFFLRRGRLSITNASGFVTRRADDVTRGIGIDLLRSTRIKASAGLRWDNGRRESSSEELRGLGDISPTARVRFSLGAALGGPFRLGLGVSSDLFGRGGGYIADASLGWSHPWSPTTVLSASVGLSFAGDRYLQTWYGITPEQALRSGRPAYQPRSSWRDASANLGFRTELSRDWVLIGGVGASRLLGEAAGSPLVTSRFGWGINGGLARRF